MCCFSLASPQTLWGRLFPPKIEVSQTGIFARSIEPGVQALAYGMNFQSTREVAMILPLPVRAGSGEDAVRFVDLEKHPNMFSELAWLFVMLEPLAKGGGFFAQSAPGPRLVVHEIGSFVASYVPTRADFARLDPRFRLPEVLFDAIPEYDSYGFAVFQLAPGKLTLHPMAFTFPTRAPDRLFFPTVHLHDGRFRETAKFDHALYYQHPACVDGSGVLPGSSFRGDDVGWTQSSNRYEGLVEEQPMLRRTLRAQLPNCDTWIDL